jgi:23S rRNA (guanosine2251-2'-O)-methyltransferase
MARPPFHPRRHLPTPAPEFDVLEGRNPVLECLLRRRRRMRLLLLDDHAVPEGKLARILDLAAEQRVPIRRVPREDLDRRSLTGVHNGVVGEAEPLPDLSLSALLADIDAAGQHEPFLVLVDEPQYEHNLGAILRSALGFGVDGVIVPTRRGKGVNAVVQRVAMGAAEVVPVVREGISSCLAVLERRGMSIVAADMGGLPPWDVRLTGPLALVLGGEDKGLSAPVLKRCQAVVTIPAEGGLESYNLSVSASTIMYERTRQAAASAIPAKAGRT